MSDQRSGEPLPAQSEATDHELHFPPRKIQHIGSNSRLAMPAGYAPATNSTSRAWNVRNFGELQQRAAELGSGTFIVESLLPKSQIGLLVGDSGVGKSALLYQLAVCVAANIPFLGYAVNHQGTVLYFDFENGLADTVEIIERQRRYLGLGTAPDNLKFWHLNDCGDGYSTTGSTIFGMVLAHRPVLAIIDSLSACSPLVEEKNPNATEFFQQLRQITRVTGTTFLSTHHLKKPSTRPQDAPPSLDEVPRARDWLLQTRGAGALINASDVRIGMDLPSVGATLGRIHNPNGEEIAAVLRGFGRVRGEIGPLYIARVLDEEGEPLAYRRLAGAELLFNPGQESAFARLGQTFTTGEAKRTYGRADQPTNDFLKKLQRIGLIRKTGRGQFQKTSAVAERAEYATNPLNTQILQDSAPAGVERSSVE